MITARELGKLAYQESARTFTELDKADSTISAHHCKGGPVSTITWSHC